MNLHALSVVAPAGDWIANQKKTIEVRSWLPETVPLLNVAIIQNEHYLLEDGQADKNGFMVAIVDFINVSVWAKQQQEAACSQDWKPGYYAWQIANVRKLAKPIKVVAKRKIYEIEVNDDCEYVS